MSNLAKGIITVGVLFFAVVVAYGLVATAPQPERVEPENIATSIRAIEAQLERVRLEVVSQGSVMPRTESELIPEVSGRVQWVSPNLVTGGFFRAEDVLLKLDDRDYQSSVGRSEAALARAVAEEELARFELHRMEELVKKQLISQSNLESVQRNHRIAEASLQDARIALEQANRDLNRTEIRAPYDGFVRTEKVDPGQYVSRGQSIASIYASDSVEVRLPVADRQLAYLDLPLGFRGELSPEQAPDVKLFTDYGGNHYEWEGKLVRTESEIDSKSRMVTAVVRVTQDRNAGKPDLPLGLFVNAAIQGREVDNIITLPRSALRNQNQVLIVDSDNRLRYRDVDILRFENDAVLISGGLATGDIVNISPLQTVIDGMQVDPIVQPGQG